MSPGNRFIDKALKLLQEREDEEVMAKLKQVDRRPKHRFEPGDIIERRGMNGLVLATELANETTYGPGAQWCYCIFAGREVDLYHAARRFMQKSAELRAQRIRDLADSHARGEGVALLNTGIQFVRKAPDSWVQSITPREVLTMRFNFIFEEGE